MRDRSAALVLLAIVTLFYWRLTFTHQYTWMDNPDVAYQVLPWFQLQAREWHAGHFPMWDPTGWGGQTLFGQAQPGAAYPPNWILFWLPLKDGFISPVALNWYYVLIRYFAALACYALCRSLGRSVGASLVGGVLYGLGGYVAATSWPQMTNGAVWSPLVFLFLFRSARDRRRSSAAMSGLCLGIGWLAGHHQMNTLVSIAAAGTWGFLVLRSGRIDWRVAGMAGLSFAIAGLTSAFQTIPMLEYGVRALRWVGAADALAYDQTVPYSVHQMFALGPGGLLGMFLPGVELTAVLFLGLVGVSLGLVGCCLGWRDRRVRWLSAIAVCGLLFTLGANSLLHGVLYSLIPLVEKARVPAAGSLIFALGFAPLAAFGVDLLYSRRNAAVAGTVARWTLGMGLAMFGLMGVSALLHLANPIDPRLGVTAICACGLGMSLWGWSLGRMTRLAATTVALSLVLFELAPSANYTFPNKEVKADNKFLPHLGDDADIARFLESEGGFPRIEYSTEDVPYNFGTWYDISARNGAVASVPASTLQMNMYSDQGRELWGERYYLGRKPNHPRQREVFQGQSGVKVFLNDAALERAWVVHRAVALPGLKEISEALADGSQMRSTAFVTGDVPDVETCDAAGESARLDYAAPNAVRVVAHANCRGLVMLSDAWFPGWGATVDGVAAKIENVDGGFRGVVVGAGRHVVDMKYRPASVFWGMGLTVLGIVLTAGIQVSRR